MYVCNSMNSIQTIKSARNDFTSRIFVVVISLTVIKRSLPSPSLFLYIKMKPEITNYFWFTLPDSLSRIRWITWHFTRNIIGLSMGLCVQWHIFRSYTVRQIRYTYNPYNDVTPTCIQSNGKLFSHGKFNEFYLLAQVK